MKKGFTFAELMICLLVISVVTAVLYPTIAQFTPNSNKPLFKSAYRIVSAALREITSNRFDGQLPICTGSTNNADCRANANVVAGADPPPNAVDSAQALCQAFCERANVIPEANNTTCPQFCQDNEIQTTNGMRWKFYDYDNTIFIIAVDVNASNNDLNGTQPANAIRNGTITFDNTTNGIFYYSDDNTANTGIYAAAVGAGGEETFNIERLKNQDTFRIEVDINGKITDMSKAGWANLEDTQAPD